MGFYYELEFIRNGGKYCGRLAEKTGFLIFLEGTKMYLCRFVQEAANRIQPGNAQTGIRTDQKKVRSEQVILLMRLLNSHYFSDKN
jgi:hypothetical protein